MEFGFITNNSYRQWQGQSTLSAEAVTAARNALTQSIVALNASCDRVYSINLRGHDEAALQALHDAALDGTATDRAHVSAAIPAELKKIITFEDARLADKIAAADPEMGFLFQLNNAAAAEHAWFEHVIFWLELVLQRVEQRGQA